MNILEAYEKGYTCICNRCFLEYRETPEHGCACGGKEFTSIEGLLRKYTPKEFEAYLKRRELLNKKF